MGLPVTFFPVDGLGWDEVCGGGGWDVGEVDGEGGFTGSCAGGVAAFAPVVAGGEEFEGGEFGFVRKSDEA